MVRVSLYTVFIIAVFMIIASIAIRTELTLSNHLSIISWIAPSHSEITYTKLVHIHGYLGLALLFICSSFIGFASNYRGFLSGYIWGFAGLALTIVTLILIFVKFYGELHGLEWCENILNLINGHIQNTSYLERLMCFDLFQNLGIALLLLSCNSIICTSEAYRTGAILLSSVTLVIFFIDGALIVLKIAPFTTSLYLVPEIVMFALLAMILFDPERNDEPHLIIGVGFTVVITLLFDLLAILRAGVPDGTYFSLAETHISQNGLAIFGFFAGYMRLYGGILNVKFKWVHANAITFFMGIMYLPLAFLGALGVNHLDIISAKEFNFLQWTSSFGSAGLIITFIVGIATPLFKVRQRRANISKQRANRTRLMAAKQSTGYNERQHSFPNHQS